MKSPARRMPATFTDPSDTRSIACDRNRDVGKTGRIEKRSDTERCQLAEQTHQELSTRKRFGVSEASHTRPTDTYLYHTTQIGSLACLLSRAVSSVNRIHANKNNTLYVVYHSLPQASAATAAFSNRRDHHHRQRTHHQTAIGLHSCQHDHRRNPTPTTTATNVFSDKPARTHPPTHPHTNVLLQANSTHHPLHDKTKPTTCTITEPPVRQTDRQTDTPHPP